MFFFEKQRIPSSGMTTEAAIIQKMCVALTWFNYIAILI